MLEAAVRHVLGVTGVESQLTWRPRPGEPHPVVPGFPAA
jgi:hypothetical protein